MEDLRYVFQVAKYHCNMPVRRRVVHCLLRDRLRRDGLRGLLRSVVPERIPKSRLEERRLEFRIGRTRDGGLEVSVIQTSVSALLTPNSFQAQPSRAAGRWFADALPTSASE